MKDKELLYADETFAIRGVCFEVYKEKGCGFVEAVYQECLEIEFQLCGLLFVPQPRLQLEYKGRKLRSEFQPDFICIGKIIVELKAVSELNDEHRAQVHNYLKSSGHRLGLLVNFGHHPGVEIERIIR
ncbi:MAG: GxxExxY protein [Verrucomicrobia bacterium]|nr:GxxExxY protein [Verrucomicrobiota bacterium]